MTRSRRLATALTVSLLVVAAAPFLGSIQSAAAAVLGKRFYVPVLGLAFALALGLVLAWTLWRIRERRAWRFALLATALLLMALQIFVWNRGMARLDAVERIHFLFYGLLALLFYRVFRWWGGIPALAATLLAVVTIGTVDEWLQWLVPVRTGEWFDVLLNSYAGLCGVLFAVAVEPLEGEEWSARSGSWRQLSRLAAATLLVLAGFVHCAHLGYAHLDDELGVHFHSYFTLDELAELSQRRAIEWREEPPPPLGPLQIEDYFRTEAGWRVSYRNAAIQNGLLFAADRENLILEKYYAPFLEIGHALSPKVRERLVAARQPGSDRIHVSPADLGRVFVWPSKTVLWIMVLAAVGTLLVGSVVGSTSSERGQRRTRS